MTEWKAMDSAPLSYYTKVESGRKTKDGEVIMRKTLHVRNIFTVSKCKQIIVSWWLPETEDKCGKKTGGHWSFYGANENPLLWCDINLPENIEDTPNDK